MHTERADGGKERGRDMRGRSYQNSVLTVIAVLLALSVADRQWGLTGPAGAQAQVGDAPVQGGGMTNALEQRKQMIMELRMISGRLERLEARLNGNVNVKVTDMPPMRFPPEVMRGLNLRTPDRPVAGAKDEETR
jgi:hypothetical protein